MRKIEKIIIHCSATKSNKRYSFEQLERDHKARGFICCGYHYYITRDGQLHFGRPEEVVGAHAKGYNARSIGICYEGGLDEQGYPADTRTPAQKAALIRLLTELKHRYPTATIHSHRDFAPKACPCFDATTEYAYL